MGQEDFPCAKGRPHGRCLHKQLVGCSRACAALAQLWAGNRQWHIAPLSSALSSLPVAFSQCSDPIMLCHRGVGADWLQAAQAATALATSLPRCGAYLSYCPPCQVPVAVTCLGGHQAVQVRREMTKEIL